MVIGIIGESCTGKSTLAEKIKEAIDAKIYTGKDYLKLAKNENEAINLFKNELNLALKSFNVIYIITEPDLIKLLPNGAIKILVKCDIETIKERFKERMHGNLPKPVSDMLEKKHGIFNNIDYDLSFDSEKDDSKDIINRLKALN